jgi:hypothetical protein
VLRETVRDQVHELETRLVARIEASLDRIERSRGAGPT